MDNQFSFIRSYEWRPAALLGVILAVIITISLIMSLLVDRKDHSIPSKTVLVPFPVANLKAKAAYVYDIRTGEVLFAKNEDTRLPLASLTKVMSALVAKELGFEHNVITIAPDALKAEGDTGLYGDERWSLKDLLDFSLVTSSNDGIRAVALSLGALSKSNISSDEVITDFVRTMNIKASELKLKNTYFWNETGLDESEIKGGAYGTARDVSSLMTYIFNTYPDLLSMTKEPVTAIQSLDNRVHLAKNTNNIVSNIPGLLASKTGYTATAGGNLTIIFDPEIGRPIVVTILGSTAEGRFEDVLALVNATLEYIHENSD